MFINFLVENCFHPVTFELSEHNFLGSEMYRSEKGYH